MPVATFPTLAGNSFPVVRTLSGTVGVNVTLAGAKTALPFQSIPRWTWQIPYEFLRAASFVAGEGPYSEMETLAAFFASRVTQGDVFAYTAADDNTATQAGFGQGDGATLDYQLVRALGGFTEPVYCATVTEIRVNGVALAPGDYAVSDKGVVTFDVAPPNGESLDWTGTYKWYCRFERESLDLGNFMLGLYSSQQGVKFSNEVIV